MQEYDRSEAAAPARSKRNVQAKQFIICLVLFFAVLVGKAVFPVQTESLCRGVWAQLTKTTDLRGALDSIGTAEQGSGTVLDELADFCIAVFGTAPEHSEESIPAIFPSGSLERELEFLSIRPDAEQLIRPDTGDSSLPDSAPAPSCEAAKSDDAEEPAISAGTVISLSDYTGEELPPHCTMDHLSLGGLNTITPVMGRLSSSYGYRSHPTSGVHRFHRGTDIAADTGTPILAFADGTVEFIGENDSFGQYIQLDHGNGVKSLYAHCSKLCASKGDTVAMGDQIALVGSTGDSTGPHLHLELKYQDTNLNPAYYIEFADQN